jgi:hypothetical protein
VEVRIDYRTKKYSLIAAKSFARDVVTVKVLIFGGTCTELGDSKTKEGGKSCNAMITPSRTKRCVRNRMGEEIVVKYELLHGHPINLLDHLVKRKRRRR